MVEMAKRMRDVLAKVRHLPERDREMVEMLIGGGEWEIALENLCTQIFEYDVELDASVRAEIMQLGETLDVATGYLLGDPWADRPSDS